ncbi:uncharacterized protein CLUP02_16702 [Colletotrichum lupini]|uniref:Uncharacterized protein n=1 Tax=Colletotrichum lupini TaxID=145971 RepID=A0A9Q8T8E7_9PEZI|nr:uncharacterized protein CLUP02_16702 [Colletotrichum lupini]UQC91168.1 hypothetical protein CLUP02_16702 [Colletotrichum lupini]
MEVSKQISMGPEACVLTLDAVSSAMVVDDRGQTRRTSWRYKTPRAKCAAKHARQANRQWRETRGSKQQEMLQRSQQRLPEFVLLHVALSAAGVKRRQYQDQGWVWLVTAHLAKDSHIGQSKHLKSALVRSVGPGNRFRVIRQNVEREEGKSSPGLKGLSLRICTSRFDLELQPRPSHHIAITASCNKHYLHSSIALYNWLPILAPSYQTSSIQTHSVRSFHRVFHHGLPAMLPPVFRDFSASLPPVKQAYLNHYYSSPSRIRPAHLKVLLRQRIEDPYYSYGYPAHPLSYSLAGTSYAKLLLPSDRNSAEVFGTAAIRILETPKSRQFNQHSTAGFVRRNGDFNLTALFPLRPVSSNGPPITLLRTSPTRLILRLIKQPVQPWTFPFRQARLQNESLLDCKSWQLNQKAKTRGPSRHTNDRSNYLLQRIQAIEVSARIVASNSSPASHCSTTNAPSRLTLHTPGGRSPVLPDGGTVQLPFESRRQSAEASDKQHYGYRTYRYPGDLAWHLAPDFPRLMRNAQLNPRHLTSAWSRTFALIGSASSAATRNMNAKANSTTQYSVQHAARTPGSKLMQRCFILTSSSSSSLLLSPTPPNERCQFARQRQHPIDSVAFLPDFRLAPSERNDRLNSSQTALWSFLQWASLLLSFHYLFCSQSGQRLHYTTLIFQKPRRHVIPVVEAQMVSLRLILGSQPLNETDIRIGVLVNRSVGADSVSRKRQHAGTIYVDDPSTQNVVVNRPKSLIS